jgi:hypothetical protein
MVEIREKSYARLAFVISVSSLAFFFFPSFLFNEWLVFYSSISFATDLFFSLIS